MAMSSISGMTKTLTKSLPLMNFLETRQRNKKSQVLYGRLEVDAVTKINRLLRHSCRRIMVGCTFMT